MNPIIKNILAIVAGLIVGGIVNMGIIMISSSIIPPPNGGDITTMEGLKETMHLFEPKNFIFPFLAHALGTLIGAIIAAKIAATNKMKIAISIGAIFLIGGITNVYMLPSPLWFSIIDILGAYILMGWIGGKIAIKKEY